MPLRIQGKSGKALLCGITMGTATVPGPIPGPLKSLLCRTFRYHRRLEKWVGMGLP